MARVTKRAFLALLGLGSSLPGRLLAQQPTISGGEPAAGRARLMHGPMVGWVSAAAIRIWLRASGRFPVSIAFSESPDMRNARETPTTRARVEDDYSATLVLDGLRPSTRYFYRVLLDGEPDPYTADRHPYAFRTAPEPAGIDRFSVAFGSCARYAKDSAQPIWHAVRQHDPDFFCWIGDNIYGDSGSSLTLADEYKRQRGVESYRAVASRIPQLAIWDDHDFAFNDSDRRNPAKQEALRLFRSFWANPGYGVEGVPGVFFDYSYGGVDFFFLDVRFYRDPNESPDVAGKTMLGRRQKAWLKQKLSASTAPFKVLVSGSGWTVAKGAGGDSWASFVTERNELFEYIRRNGIEGVILVSGDTHVAELNAIPWSERGGYDFYDLTSSPLAQPTSDSWLERYPERRIRQAYFGTSNFGLLAFEMEPDPVLTYTAIDTAGRAVWETFRIRASELRNGASSWYDKMDETSRIRFDRFRRDEPYYQ